ncbi:hypothetical protein Ancab_017928 [Ancistrocladus abbreviatus]
MGRRPCCTNKDSIEELGLPWKTKLLLITSIPMVKATGESFQKEQRCGKSCRLCWSNYLRPDIKSSNITRDEEDLIIRLHKLLDNRWSLIARRLLGRTDNEIKNYWNTCLRKKIQSQEQYISLPIPWSNDYENPPAYQPPPTMESKVVRVKAVKCTTVFIEPLQPPSLIEEHPNTCNPPHPIIGEVENDVIIVSNDDDKYPGTSGENAFKFLMDLESMNDLIDFNLSDLLDYCFCPNILEFGN